MFITGIHAGQDEKASPLRMPVGCPQILTLDAFSCIALRWRSVGARRGVAFVISYWQKTHLYKQKRAT